MTAVEIPVVLRHLCPFCGRKAYSSPSGTRRHMATCPMNPAQRSCSSCVHFRRHPCCTVASDQCGCGGLNECAVEAFRKPIPDLGWTDVVDWRRDCPSYEPKDGDR